MSLRSVAAVGGYQLWQANIFCIKTADRDQQKEGAQ